MLAVDPALLTYLLTYYILARLLTHKHQAQHWVLVITDSRVSSISREIGESGEMVIERRTSSYSLQQQAGVLSPSLKSEA